MSALAKIVTVTALTATLAAGIVPTPTQASPLNPPHHVCFFKGVGFTGDVICFQPGARQFMPAHFANAISSIQVVGDVSATLCTGRVKRGTCKTFADDVWQVPSPLHNNARSFQIQRDQSLGFVQTIPVMNLSLASAN